MRQVVYLIVMIFVGAAVVQAEDLGNLSANPFDFESSSNPFGKGSPFAPTLLGPAFLNKWRGRPAAELLTQMRDTMPPRATGTRVDPAALPDVLAMLVRANLQGLPAMVAGPVAPPAVAPRVAIPYPLPAPLAQRIDKVRGELDVQHKAIERKENERAEAVAAYESKLARWRELKARQDKQLSGQ